MKKAVFKTSMGWVGLAAPARGVSALVLPKPSRRAAERELQNAGAVDETSSNGEGRATATHLKAARVAVQAYLAGKARSFALPLDRGDHSPFQMKVWEVLRGIPYGRVRSYGWV